MSTDMWEHIDDDEAVARETVRVLRPGGRALVAVPCSMKLWSGHDVALGHERRYERDELVGLMEKAGLEVVDVMSWNVLLRPVARVRRRRRVTSESEMEPVHPVLNAGSAGGGRQRAVPAGAPAARHQPGGAGREALTP